jgi:hypothetical protein
MDMLSNFSPFVYSFWMLLASSGTYLFPPSLSLRTMCLFLKDIFQVPTIPFAAIVPHLRHGQRVH